MHTDITCAQYHAAALSRYLSSLVPSLRGLEALTKFVTESHAFSKVVPDGFADHG